MKRRAFLLNTAIALVMSRVGFARPNGISPPLGVSQIFSVDWLRQRAQKLSARPYQSAIAKLPKPLQDLSADDYREIRYRPSNALWSDRESRFNAQFFHMGFYYKDRVRVYEVVGQQAREIMYDPGLFDFGKTNFDRSILSNRLGFTGVRIHSPLNTSDYLDELIAFHGASYFRALGRGMRYGTSARGLAIATASEQGEEFPNFVEFYLERPTDPNSLVIHALLDSPSTTGAYTFTIRPGDVTITDVSLTLYPRKPLSQIGIAALTSMFYFGPNDRLDVDDFRNAVHDSDGLMIWNGAGERLWRPLVNPERLRISSFLDHNPHGFGLMQRERNLSDYEDLDARYELRPSAWVEPIGNWGKGAVRLVEIPTPEEINDNIVAFWQPEQAIAVGAQAAYTYRLHWCAAAPIYNDLALVTGTRVGAGKEEGTRKFVIDFAGAELPRGADMPIETMVWASGGSIKNVSTQFNEGTGNWRSFFELQAGDANLVELRCFLKLEDRAMSEIWTYQWTAA